MNDAVMSIYQDPRVLTYVERFESSTEQNKGDLETVQSHLRDNWKADAAFIGATVLNSRKQGGLAIYSQWKRRAGEVCAAIPEASRSLESILKSECRLDAKCFSLEFSMTSPYFSPPVRISMQGTPHAHFGLFTTAIQQQNEMVERARANAPQSLVVPGLLAVNFHRSLDGTCVLNLGLWSNFDDFSTLPKQQGFHNEKKYWTGAASFQPDFFDVIAVVTASRSLLR